MNDTKDLLIEKIERNLDAYLNDLDENIKREILEQKKEIIEKLLTGKFRDLGGLTAMRGFVYQYYVAMYYMLSMIYSKYDVWWNSVVLEYFDDIALIGDNKIRFIQVKTVKEGGITSHQPNDFYKRKPLVNPDNNRAYFNSWVEKNILNYDYFLESKVYDEIDKNIFKPQFEIVSNTPQNSLTSLKKYTENVDFEIKEDIGDEDALKKAILKPIENFKFEDYAIKKVDYYLKKLYINKLGSSTALRDDIMNIIEETSLVTDIRVKSIAEHVFEKMFAFVISNSHEDNESRIKRGNLIVTSLQISQLIKEWTIEAKELISESSYYDTAWDIFKRIIDTLRIEFNTQFLNDQLKKELCIGLNWVNQHIVENVRINHTYCVSILNKIFNANNNLSMWDFKHGDVENNLKESIRFIVYFMVFYEENSEVYNNAKLLFNEAKSSVIDNILFTLYHARNNSNKATSIEKIKSCINECEVSRQITFDLYCLLLGTKKDSINPDALDIGAMFKVTNIPKSLHKITDVPDNIRFIDAKEIEDLFEIFKDKGLELDSFKQEKLLTKWQEYLNKIVDKMRVKYIESRKNNQFITRKEF